jgi:hypothetical protein
MPVAPGSRKNFTQNVNRAPNCTFRPKPAWVITPNVAGFAMSNPIPCGCTVAPWRSNWGELVTLLASTRNSSCTPSVILVVFTREPLSPIMAGPRRKSSWGDVGEIVYWFGNRANAVVSKKGFRTCFVTGSTTSPSLSLTDLPFEGLRRTMGLPLTSVIERGDPVLDQKYPEIFQPPTSCARNPLDDKKALPGPKGNSSLTGRSS